jgi:hypothetical protein
VRIHLERVLVVLDAQPAARLADREDVDAQGALLEALGSASPPGRASRLLLQS